MNSVKKFRRSVLWSVFFSQRGIKKDELRSKLYSQYINVPFKKVSQPSDNTDKCHLVRRQSIISKLCTSYRIESITQICKSLNKQWGDSISQKTEVALRMPLPPQFRYYFTKLLRCLLYGRSQLFFSINLNCTNSNAVTKERLFPVINKVSLTLFCFGFRASIC